jgi:hypothetical protein
MNRLLFSSCLLAILTLSHADLSWPQPTIAPADSAVAEAESLAHVPVKVPIPPAVTPAITVAIYDDVHLSPRVLADAQDEATRVYQKAGVAIIWIRCKSSKMDAEPDLRCQDPPSAMRLNLRIVPHARKSSDGVFGVAFLSAEGTGAYSDVFYDSVEKLDRDWNVGLVRVLGHVMAHELGHLLLGSNAHSRQGIMCPSWHGDELHLASMGALLFSQEQARFMRERLASYGKADPKAKPDPAIKILVYNIAQAPRAVLAEAEREAGRILSKAGVQVSWIECSAGHSDAEVKEICQNGWGPINIGLRILVLPTAFHNRFQGDPLGFAISPALASVYYDHRLRFVADDVGLGLPRILGCFIAHEVGHLMLGSNSHSHQGLMQAGWGETQIHQALAGDLLFTSNQAKLIQTEARTRMSLQTGS